jgi:transposase
MLLPDKVYESDAIRKFIRSRGGWANIPPQRNRKGPICFSPCPYQDRNQVERFLNRIKHRRRIVTRYEKLAANFLAVVKRAAIRSWLCAYDSTT